jgi:UDP-N-acetylmuramate--alanine ligase
MPGRKLVAVFQPHLYSRTRDFAAGFGEALLAADVAIVLPIYPARERPIEGVDSEMVVTQARSHGHRDVSSVAGFEEAMVRLAEAVEPGAVVITMGAGDVDQVAETWLGRAS